jgi:hypothetical protein
MANTFVASRAQLMWAVCLPLAILIGFLLAEPQESASLAVLVFLAAVFILVFGSFSLDFCAFTGRVGLGLSLNGGVSQPEAAGPVEDEDLAWSRFQRNERRI